MIGADPETDHTDTGHPNLIPVPPTPILACTKCGCYVAFPDAHTDRHAIDEGDTE